jgi:hypothetical protein
MSGLWFVCGLLMCRVLQGGRCHRGLSLVILHANKLQLPFAHWCRPSHSKQLASSVQPSTVPSFPRPLRAFDAPSFVCPLSLSRTATTPAAFWPLDASQGQCGWCLDLPRRSRRANPSHPRISRTKRRPVVVAVTTIACSIPPPVPPPPPTAAAACRHVEPPHASRNPRQCHQLAVTRTCRRVQTPTLPRQRAA